MFGYTKLLNELSKNPAMSGAQLGKVICVTYWDDSKNTDKEFNIDFNAILTLSVTDLSENKMETLKTAYDNFGDYQITELVDLKGLQKILLKIFPNLSKPAVNSFLLSITL